MLLNSALIFKNPERATFKDVKLIEGDSESPFYLDVTYEIENLDAIFELHMPRISVKNFLEHYRVPRISCELSDCFFHDGNKIKYFIEEDYGLDPILILENEYELKLIKNKVQEMTLSEIEKKLGHPVKIISKKGVERCTKQYY